MTRRAIDWCLVAVLGTLSVYLLSGSAGLQDAFEVYCFAGGLVTGLTAAWASWSLVMETLEVRWWA